MSRRVFEISVKRATGGLLDAEFEDVTVTVDRSVARLRVLCPRHLGRPGILDHIEALGLGLLDVHAVDDPPPR
jgi:hypothetical protein